MIVLSLADHNAMKLISLFQRHPIIEADLCTLNQILVEISLKDCWCRQVHSEKMNRQTEDLT